MTELYSQIYGKACTFPDRNGRSFWREKNENNRKYGFYPNYLNKLGSVFIGCYDLLTLIENAINRGGHKDEKIKQMDKVERSTPHYSNGT
ncbi:hypothetical protein YSY22_51330 [Brevibacillus formosus]